MKQNNIKYSGDAFLTWGYSVIIFSLVVYISLKLTENNWFYIAYIGVPLLANMILHHRRKVENITEKLINAIWLLFGIVAILCCIGRYFYDFPLFALLSLLMGMETIITGIIIKYNVIILLGFSGILGTIPLILIAGHEQNLIILFVFLMIAVIPGHILNKRSNKTKFVE